MYEIEFYAPGLRDAARLRRFGQELETHPGIRYKVDTNHDIVYFEFDEPDMTSFSELRSFFRVAGLVPRLVGERPEELPAGKSGETQKLGSDTQRIE
jgi:hypothetical protein